MGHQRRQSPARVWRLAESQHGVVTRAQLLELGLSPDAIKHRITNTRLHPVGRGVYAVGRPRLRRLGRWIAAVLSCGSDAVLSHRSAGALWEIAVEHPSRIEVSVPARVRRARPGIVVHRRTVLAADATTRHHGRPVTTPIFTLIDLAASLGSGSLERAINEADKRGLTDPESLRAALGAQPGRPGIARLREALDRRTFVLTDSELERRFLPLAQQAELPLPETQVYVCGFKVDFYWRSQKLVVETDGLRYHRTPSQQARDGRRDQVLAAAGFTCLRFTHAQIEFEPEHVVATLSAVARRLGTA